MAKPSDDEVQGRQPVMIDPQDHAALKKRWEHTGLSIAEQVRRAIRDYLAKDPEEAGF